MDNPEHTSRKCAERVASLTQRCTVTLMKQRRPPDGKNDQFFEETSEQSIVKTAIVYDFWAWQM